jgi:hypothetical protein
MNYIDIAVSKDGGRVWSDWRKVPMGELGDFLYPVVTRRWGIGQHIVFKWRVTDDVRADVFAASIQTESAGQ